MVPIFLSEVVTGYGDHGQLGLTGKWPGMCAGGLANGRRRTTTSKWISLADFLG